MAVSRHGFLFRVCKWNPSHDSLFLLCFGIRIQPGACPGGEAVRLLVAIAFVGSTTVPVTLHSVSDLLISPLVWLLLHT